MKRFTLVLMIMVWPMLLFCQEKKVITTKLKTITVVEQKYEKGSAGKENIESVTRYDQAGNITEEIEYKLGKVDKHMTYQYDAAGNKILETEMDPSGKKIKETTYKYTNNLRTEKMVYDGNKHLILKKTYKYETY